MPHAFSSPLTPLTGEPNTHSSLIPARDQTRFTVWGLAQIFGSAASALTLAATIFQIPHFSYAARIALPSFVNACEGLRNFAQGVAGVPIELCLPKSTHSLSLSERVSTIGVGFCEVTTAVTCAYLTFSLLQEKGDYLPLVGLSLPYVTLVIEGIIRCKHGLWGRSDPRSGVHNDLA